MFERSVRRTSQSAASGAPPFKSRSDFLLVYFAVVSIDLKSLVVLVNSSVVAYCNLEFCKLFCFELRYDHGWVFLKLYE